MGLFAWLAFTLNILSQSTSEVELPKWERWEGNFQASSLKDQTPEKIEFGIQLKDPAGNKFTWPGFWDGDKNFKIRLRPDQEGIWSYETYSKPALEGIHGSKGTIKVIAPTGKNRWSKHGMVRVIPNKTYLEHQDGTPFFWLGDTVWNGPLLSTEEDWTSYLQDRTRKGFSVVQFNMLAPWRTAEKDSAGNKAFGEQKPIQISIPFFRNLDRKMDAMEASGFLAAPVMVWSLTKNDPGYFLADEDIILLCKYELARYGSHPIVWILAGDNSYQAQAGEKWKKIGREVFGNVPHAPVTSHPTGRNWPWESWKSEKWLNILAYQSGHGDDNTSLKWTHSGPVQASLAKGATKPVINLEPPYEDHLAYQSKKPITAYQVRRAIYWSLLTTPTAGVTYGAHGMWSWQTTAGVPLNHPGSGIAQPWKTAKDLPGANQIQHLAKLMETIPWWNLMPDQLLLTQQPGANDPSKFIACSRTRDFSTVLAYLPKGGAVQFRGIPNPQETESEEWWNPMSGRKQKAKRDGFSFSAPDNDDWLLIIRKKQ